MYRLSSFEVGTGGHEIYKGKDMISVHKDLNIFGDELVSALDDILNALATYKFGKKE